MKCNTEELGLTEVDYDYPVSWKSISKTFDDTNKEVTDVECKYDWMMESDFEVSRIGGHNLEDTPTWKSISGITRSYA